MSPSEELLDLLSRAVKIGESMANSFHRGAKALEVMAAKMPAPGAQAASSSSSSSPNGVAGGVAPDADLDSEWGDPLIKFDPKRWEGRSYVECHFSQTEPEYLDALAAFLDWKADRPQAGKEKFAAYNRKDAARARGWAHRLRNGYQARPAPSPPEPESADDFDPPC